MSKIIIKVLCLNFDKTIYLNDEKNIFNVIRQFGQDRLDI